MYGAISSLHRVSKKLRHARWGLRQDHAQQCSAKSAYNPISGARKNVELQQAMLGHTCHFEGFSADATPLFCASSLSRPWLCLLAVCCRSCEAIVNLASSVRSFVDTTTFLLLNSFVGTAPTQTDRQPLKALCCNPDDGNVIYTVHNGMLINPNQVRLQNLKRSSQNLQDKRTATGSYLR